MTACKGWGIKHNGLEDCKLRHDRSGCDQSGQVRLKACDKLG